MLGRKLGDQVNLTGAVGTILVACCMSARAEAGDFYLPAIVWKAAPTKADVDAVFPRSEIGHGSGSAWLGCQLKPDGSLFSCDSHISGVRAAMFERAARSLLPKFSALVPASIASEKDRRFVNIRFSFRDPRQAPEAVDLADPQYLQVAGQPLPADAFPQGAADIGLRSGLAVIECDGKQDGRLTNCVVTHETPAGVGFAAEALTIAATLQLNPWQGGDPLDGSRVRIPLYIDAPDATAAADFTQKAIFHVASGYPGTAGPFYPERAWRLHVTGTAIIQCVASAAGALSDCAAVSEEPTDYEFMAAALLMARRAAITIKPTGSDRADLGPKVVRVVVPFSL
jgi:Gram-negative bacterial TonB protein C-terminal